MQNIIVNTSDIARAREALADVFGSLDNKRPTAWATYGYPQNVSFAQILSAYERFGPAHGAVHRLLDKCWESLPRIKQPGADKETAWEKRTASVLKQANAWASLRDFDRRNLVGRYSALIYRVADSLPLREPMKAAKRLVELVPVCEDQIRVEQWDVDKTSDRYGLPVMYGYKRRRIDGGDTQGQPTDWEQVHHTRVQILAEGSVGDMFDGVPLLRAGFNHLVDLEKISGGSAESYLKNSARTIVFQYAPEASPQAITSTDGNAGKTVRQVHEEQTRALNSNTDASIVMQGGQANTLQTSVSDPTGAYLLAANLFSAAVRIPFAVLFGQQTGRLASDEDRVDMNARGSARRENELTPMLTEFITRMQAAGIIEQGEFEIEWPPLDTPGDEDKANLLTKLTSAMQDASDSGIVEPLFDANELRALMGFEPRTNDGMPEEGDPVDDESPGSDTGDGGKGDGQQA